MQWFELDSGDIVAAGENTVIRRIRKDDVSIIRLYVGESGDEYVLFRETDPTRARALWFALKAQLATDAKLIARNLQ